jgi:hypothetical protein
MGVLYAIETSKIRAARQIYGPLKIEAVFVNLKL